MAGCTTTKKITGKIMDDVFGEDRTLRMKVAFLPPSDSTALGGQDLGNAATAELARYLSRECPGLHIVESGPLNTALSKLPRLASGGLDNLALAELGRIHGLNAVLEQTVSDLQCTTDKRGIWGFRETCLLVELSVRIRAYDVETTATFLDEVVWTEVEVPQDSWEAIKKAEKYDKAVAGSLVSGVVPKIGELLCEPLDEMPWKGFIIKGSGTQYTVSAGSDVGLAPGNVLEVFGIGDPIRSLGDSVFLVTGPKIGEIKITSVKEHESQAVGISGTDLDKSSCVRLRPLE